MKAKVRLNSYNDTIIKISGSKNSSLPIIAASILCDEEVVINNVPNVSDINKLISIMKKFGYNISFNNNTVVTKPTLIKQNKFYNSDIKKIRGSYYLIGSLIGKYIYSDFSFKFPGGCNFNYRPIDYHLEAFKNMGISCVTKRNIIFFNGQRNSAIHDLKYPSVGTTINIILASCKINGKTIINNASIEPEVLDVCNFIKSMGCNIIIKDRTIIIEGTVYFKGTNYSIMGDRIEAATFLTLGALHKGITITNIDYNCILPIINLFKEIGCSFDYSDNFISLYKINKPLKPFNICLDPYPGIPTDIGPILCVLASQINGTSKIIDNVYPNRLTHIKELKKFNIDIKVEDKSILITGKNNICSTKAIAHDLRCCASLIVCASLCYNYSYIYHIEKAFRGYENLKDKLNNLGIDFI